MTRAEPFVHPVLTTPLDLAAHLSSVPTHGKVKGMFFRRIVDETKALTGRAFDGRPYFPFSDYPLTEWLTLLHDAARYAYPRDPVRSGLRRLGRSMYPTFAETTVGKVIFSVAGNSVLRALPLYPKIWSVISNHGTAEVDELRPGRAVIRLRHVWDFVDCFQLGALEGGMAFFGVDADVKARVLGPCDADYEIVWSSR